ncbi:serine hydrolase [Ramlibacter sp.]|uniref:serine hydrolase domain-containing protein n=1 Tax=Ramlibacter sp. TaxID=1917967 RepID=UPI0025DD5DDE|nr:serine hydrolase [Ramlibacter sp.]
MGTELRSATLEEASADAQAFADVEQALRERLADIQSVVVLLGGRVAYQFHRDGTPDALRDGQSVEKSALSALTGTALMQGKLRGLDQPIVELVPEWAALNADPRTRGITVKHLLTMSAGFDQKDAAGTAAKLRPAQAWSRPLASTPGDAFSYDNSLIPMLGAVLEKATGMPLPDYARQQLGTPLAMAEPTYRHTLHLRTIDMAKLGQLFLREGRWDGVQLLSPGYVADATRPQNAGGPPVGMEYGYMWWITPAAAPRRTFMASGYGGQLVWVHPPLDLVVAVTSTVSPQSQARGQAVQLVRNGVFAAAQKLQGTAR